MTLEMLTALALLSIALLPLAVLQTASTLHVHALLSDAAVSEMLGDRLAILRMGGWREHGICSEKEIEFIGEAAGELPDGRLLLTIGASDAAPHLLDITLSWQPERGRTIERATAAFAPRDDMIGSER